MIAFYKILFPIFLFLSISAFAPEDYLPEKQEKRAYKLFLQVNCPVCGGQTIESSDTKIALELRKIIRDQIKQGKTDQEIKNYLIKIYGNNILNSAPLNQKTLILWLLPIIFLVIGIFIVVFFIRR